MIKTNCRVHKFFIVLLIVFLAGCSGRGVGCEQSNLKQNFLGVLEGLMVEQMFGIYWAVFSNQINLKISSVKEHPGAQDRNSARCVATLNLSAPNPKGGVRLTDSLLLGLRLASASAIDGDLSLTVEYNVAKREEGVQIEYLDLSPIVLALTYRNIQMAGSALARPINEWDRAHWRSSELKALRSAIDTQAGFSVLDRKIGTCTVTGLATLIPYDTYMAYLATIASGNNNVVLSVSVALAIRDAPFSNIVEVESRIRRSCGG